MNGFTKLFQTIVTSSIWSQDDKTRIVWVTMLALADRDGNVAASIPGLADVSRVPLEDCERAIKSFLEPDKYSRTTDHEGRRIQAIPGGWHLLNHGLYRSKMNADERREYKARKQKEYRAKGRQSKNKPLYKPNGMESYMAKERASLAIDETGNTVIDQ